MFSLLACGSMVLSIVSVVRFFARGAKKRTTKEDKALVDLLVCAFSARSAEKAHTTMID